MASREWRAKKKTRDAAMAERRKQYEVEAETRRKADAWMTGWRAGAAFTGIPPEYQDCPHFAAGYVEGRAASKTAKGRLKELYEFEYAVIRLATEAP